MQTVFCVWAVGRAAGAIAGELDRGTMELLLAQPLPRWRLLLAHLLVDLITIPALCLSLWGGTALGCWLIGPIQLRDPGLKTKPPTPAQTVVLEAGPFRVKLEDPVGALTRRRPTAETEAAVRDRLAVDLAAFGRGLWVVGGLMFAVTGATM